jgi:hypothetical protein
LTTIVPNTAAARAGGLCCAAKKMRNGRQSG